jgi:hypothetical protein
VGEDIILHHFRGQARNFMDKYVTISYYLLQQISILLAEQHFPNADFVDWLEIFCSITETTLVKGCKYNY